MSEVNFAVVDVRVFYRKGRGIPEFRLLCTGFSLPWQVLLSLGQLWADFNGPPGRWTVLSAPVVQVLSALPIPQPLNCPKPQAPRPSCESVNPNSPTPKSF